ncbi:uncharacterized protein EDB91DRAFT_63176 [Suillus paluster]|uniref:uncharacterized protein n=1 Tax=Suillus paluster TaxID=48578 RepID=UPI001B862EEB|nr:uncharacterized protein EDB91DRAFT_63176 [Suillus paluster]KAG1726046.1 hypothetical protein EDB91DRAFT_63176 [Suillus paluster]
MSTSANPHTHPHPHAQSTSHNPWGSTSGTGPLGTSLTDTFGQSRTQYQPGYMMSVAQHNVMSPSAQNTDEIPVVQTKAKINKGLTRGGASHFGAESMFESSSTQRQTFADMDAPPTSSVNDIFREGSSFGESQRAVLPPSRPFSLNSPSTLNISQSKNHTQPATPNQSTYIIVFGYPPDKYSLTVEYFRSLGASTEPEPNSEIVNAFRIGFRDPGEAMRAVRRNGEVLGGTWMVGVKWADPAQDLTLSRAPDFMASVSPSRSQIQTSQVPDGNAMAVDGAATVGTPIKLAPAVAAFRKAPAPAPQKSAHAMPIPIVNAQQSPARGMLGQVGDLLFGW